MRTTVLAASLLLTACGAESQSEDAGLSSNQLADLAVLDEGEPGTKEAPLIIPLQPLSLGEIQEGIRPGAGCDLNQGESILMVASLDGNGLAKAGDALVRLTSDGPTGPTGGYFSGPGLSISVGRTGDGDGVITEETRRWPVEVAVRADNADKPVAFRAFWRCGA